MREIELREKSICGLCGQKVGKSSPVFYRTRVTVYVLDLAAIQRQVGLTAVLGGNARIAQAMGMDEEMAKKMDEHEMTLCSECAVRSYVISAALETVR